MNPSIWKLFILFLIIINAITWSVAAVFPNLYGISWSWSMTFLVVLNALSFLIFQKSLKQKPKEAVLFFLALTIGKMLLAIIYILVLVMGLKIDSLNDSLFFVILYMMFLALEVLVFTKNVNKDKNNN